MLAILYSIFSLLWLPRILGPPQAYDVWGNFFEELSLVIAGVLLWVSLALSDSTWPGKAAHISRLYGSVSFHLHWSTSFTFRGPPASSRSGFHPDNCSGQ
jgi:hypothetical protein